MPKRDIRIKRAYDAPAKDDGVRILVDRLWPRGITKEKAALDEWMKEIAPSNELRKKFHGHPDQWDEFCRAYAKALDGNSLVDDLLRRAKAGRVTLLFAAKDPDRNNAAALRDYLLKHAQE